MTRCGLMDVVSWSRRVFVSLLVIVSGESYVTFCDSWQLTGIVESAWPLYSGMAILKQPLLPVKLGTLLVAEYLSMWLFKRFSTDAVVWSHESVCVFRRWRRHSSRLAGYFQFICWLRLVQCCWVLVIADGLHSIFLSCILCYPLLSHLIDFVS